MGARFPAGQPPADGPSDLTVVRPAEPEPPGVDLARDDINSRRRPHTVLLLSRLRIGVWRWPWMSRRGVRALLAEHGGIGPPRDGVHATHGEAVVHSIARRRSGRVLQTTFRRLSWMNRGIDRLKARHATLLARITLIPDEHVAHPSGGHRTLSRTEADRDTLAARVDQERGQNSRKHDRLPRWFRHLPRVVLVFDFLLLLYFLSGITDVNWSNPESPQLAFAVGLAAMITLVSYGCFALAGDRLRAHKGHAGRIPFGGLDWLTWVIVIASTVGILVLGVLMFSRMWSEVLVALGDGARITAISVAAAVAAVSILANVMVISVHAKDGSEETDRLDAFGAALRRPLLRRDRMRRRAARLEHRIAVRIRKAQRYQAAGRTRAERPPMIADEVVTMTHAIHQGIGPLSEARISALGRSSAEYRRADPVTGAADRALRLIDSQLEAGLGRTGTDRPEGPAMSRPVPRPRPAPEP